MEKQEFDSLVKSVFFSLHDGLIQILESEAKTFADRYRRTYSGADRAEMMKQAAILSSIIAKLFRVMEKFMEDFASFVGFSDFSIENSPAQKYEQGAVNFMAGKIIQIPHNLVSNSIH